MGLVGRRRSDRCSSRLSPAEARSRRRLTPQRLRSRPRWAQSPPRWRTHRRPSHQSVARTWVTQERRSYAGGCPRSASRNMPTSTARSVRQSIRSRRRCGLRVRRNLLADRGSPLTIWRMAVGLGPMLVLLGIAMLVNFERYRCVAAETLARRPIYSDGMALRGVRRGRNTGSPWRGHQPHVKCGWPLDAPPPRSRQRRAEPRRDGELRNAWREPRIGLRLVRWFRR
jgi:hypothetical protein